MRTTLGPHVTHNCGDKGLGVPDDGFSGTQETLAVAVQRVQRPDVQDGKGQALKRA